MPSLKERLQIALADPTGRRTRLGSQRTLGASAWSRGQPVVPCLDHRVVPADA